MVIGSLIGSLVGDAGAQAGAQVVAGRAFALVVVGEQVVAEVVAVVAPDGVDVVAVVDGVVELEKQVAALDAVVVWSAALVPAGPAEPQVVQALALDPVELLAGELVGGAAQVGGDEADERVALGGVQGGADDALGLVLAEPERLPVLLGDRVPGDAQVDGVRVLDLADE